MGQKSSLYRTVAILKRLNEGKKLCVDALALEYEVSERTIRRDFTLIRELFGNFVSKEGLCYRAYKKVLLDEVLNASDLMTLANIVTLFNLADRSAQISKETQLLVKHALQVYDFRTRPFETLPNTEVLKKLEHAIKFHKSVKIRYRTDRSLTHANFHPYRILFLNENFYLVGENRSKKHFEFRRIALIEEVKYRSHTFIPHSEIDAFIRTIQTPWANFGQADKTVRLRVGRKVKRFFLLKKYLPSQSVIEECEDGDVLVEYRVTNYHEVEELIIRWLPDVQIVSPKNLRKMLKRSLQRKLEGLIK